MAINTQVLILTFVSLVSFLGLSGCSDDQALGAQNTQNIRHEQSTGVLLANGDYAPVDLWAGQWRVVNIWAEWCKPCWHEIPELNEFHALQMAMEADEVASSVRLIGFNFDELEQPEQLALIEKMAIEFPSLISWPQVWQKPEIKGLPATLIIAPDNSVKDVLWGPQTQLILSTALQKAGAF